MKVKFMLHYLAMVGVIFFFSSCADSDSQQKDHEGHAKHNDHSDKETEEEHVGHNEEKEKAGHDDHDDHEADEKGKHDDHGESEKGEHEGHGDHDESAKGESDEHEEEAIQFSAEQIKDFGISIELAEAGALNFEVSLNGEIRPNGDRVAHVIPRFPGIVKKVFNNIGDYVEKGQTISVIESNETLVDYDVKSPISGWIIEKHITLSEYIREGEQAFLIGNLNTVWVDLSIYEKDFSKIKKGQSVSILGKYIDKIAKGTITYVSPVLDEHTRTAIARVVLPNKSKLWKPGMFITGNVSVDLKEVPLKVKLEALQVVEDKTVVFVQDEDGFEAKPIITGRKDSEFIEVLGGINVGDKYVSKGSFTLKAEQLKSSLSDGHNH